MKPTKGKLNIIERRRILRDGRESVDLFCRPSPVSISVLDWDFIAGKVARNDAALIAEAWNACQEINPENPIAAAAAMPEIWRLMREVAAASQRICPPFDSERRLREVEAVVLKATARE